MNTKHIEQITSEQTIGEIQHLALDDNMLTTALNKPYADATSLGEVQPSAPVTSDVEEIPSWMTYLIRKMFGTTTKVFRGASLLSEFRAVYSWLRNRLKGTADGVIPAVPLDSSKPMSEHLRLLDSRDMSSGLTLTLPTGSASLDGLSLAQLLCASDVADKVAELKDENVGWTMDKSLSLQSLFANLKSVILNCSEINKARINCKGIESISTPVLKLVNTIGDSKNATFYNVDAEEITINVEEVVKPNLHSRLIEGTTLKRIYLPTLKRGNLGGNDTAFVYSPVLEELYMPSVENIISNGQNYMVRSDVFKKVVYGKLSSIPALEYAEQSSWSPAKNLIHLEVGEGTDCNLPLQKWSPTTALSERLPEFLSNFQNYIADRVADRTGLSALTITLSSAVYAALEAQEGQTILATLTSKNWTVASV